LPFLLASGFWLPASGILPVIKANASIKVKNFPKWMNCGKKVTYEEQVIGPMALGSCK
jgi:hypothetical protein